MGLTTCISSMTNQGAPVSVPGSHHVGEGGGRGGIQRVVGVEEVLAVIAEGGETRRKQGIDVLVGANSAASRPKFSEMTEYLPI